jgi:hypothetical protein
MSRTQSAASEKIEARNGRHTREEEPRQRAFNYLSSREGRALYIHIQRTQSGILTKGCLEPGSLGCLEALCVKRCRGESGMCCGRVW